VCYSVKFLRRIGSFGRAIHRIYRWVVLTFIAACAVASSSFAQESGNVPVIRIESRQVLIPTRVWAKVEDSDYEEVHLSTRDFRLFEDEKEQTIEKVMLIRPYRSPLLADNQGNQYSIALNSMGEWTSLGSVTRLLSFFATPIYEIAYRPPESPEGSCHTIKIKVEPKSESGNRMTTVEMGQIPFGNRILNPMHIVNRRDLLLDYRTQYCNVTHSASDPLYGTPAGDRLEIIVNSDKAEVEGFSLSAVDFHDESNTSRVRVALDFPHLSNQTGIPDFQVTLLGFFSRANGGIAARFSDSKEMGCRYIENESDDVVRHLCGRDFFYNHYETEVDLPPGDHNLRVAIDFGGALRRAEVPVHVRAPEKSLAVSGIALCKRYFAHDQPQQGPLPPPDGIPTLPFELKPLVSKGIELTPTADTRFKKKDPLAAYFEVYEPLLTSGGNVHAQFEMRVIDAKTGEVKSDSGFKPADGYVNPGKVVIPISQKVAIEELSAGEYQVQVRAKDSSGNSTDWRTTSFTRE
jgi:hypothetical protein